ncbi:unnamed protein product [Protopolystoma xenopodis]|uniref:EF-hand domain-containing protein n=1 Tax=Protopolystoma xenopodis TaxID=117903 RepID=A0A448X1T1_9PLAT|nr:unnamed protein product [Protopolystoma xenopodis]
MGSSHGKLSKEELEKLSKDTNFSIKELKEWHAGFLKDCPSGNLDRRRFRDVYSSFFPGGDAGKFADIVFRSFDTDNNGAISFQEFMVAMSVTSKGNIEQKLSWAFDMYDIDGNGYITLDELTEIIRVSLINI